MISRFFFFLTSALFCFSFPLKALDFLAEAKAGYFGPTSDSFSNVYTGGGIYGLELTGRVYKYLYLFGSASCFPKTGHSIGIKTETKCIYVPIGFGFKCLYPIRSCDLYGGLGVLGGYLRTNDHSSFVVHPLTKWGVGGIAKGGLILNVKKHFFFDLFGDYSLIWIKNKETDGGRVVPHSVNLSGWSAGVGIGYRFTSIPCTPAKK